MKEKEYVESILNQDEINENVAYKLRLIAKYYYHAQKFSVDQTYQVLVDIMSKKYIGFSISSWQTFLLNLAKQAKKKPMFDIDYIPVTENELITINSLHSKQLQRLAFTILCLAKYRNAINPQNNDWINYKYKDIFKLANIQVSVKQQCYLIHDLKTLGLIRMSKLINNLSINVCYIDKEDSKEILKIHDFKNLGYEYLLYKGENFKRCTQCNTPIRKRGKRKYCSDCAKEIDRKKAKTRMSKIRNL